MKFTAKAKNLLREVSKIEKVANQNSPLPAQKNIFIDVADLGMTLKAFNHESDISLYYSEDGFIAEPGNIAVNAKLFGDLLRKIGDQLVTVIAGTTSVQVSWKGGKSTIPSYDVAEWCGERDLGDVRTMDLVAVELRKAFATTVDACGKDANRPALGGVLMEFSPEGSALVGSDAKKLNIYELKDVAGAPVQGEPVCGVIVPQASAKVALSILDEGSASTVQVSVGLNAVRIAQGDTVLTVSSLNGKYPHWRKLIPDAKPANIMSIDKEVFLEIVRRIRVCADAQTQVIRLDVKPGETLTDGLVTMSGEDLGNAVSAEEDCACQYKGEARHIAFRGADLELTLESLPCKSVSLYIVDEKKAAYLLPVEPERMDCGAQALLMPMMSNRPE